MRKVFISQYYGAITIRLYDTELKKNVAKIDWGNLQDYLTKKVQNKKLKKEKGNVLPVITL